MKESDYKTSIKNIQSLDLDAIVKDFSNTQQGKEIERIISMYRDWCEARLRTFQDLLRFMLTIKSRVIKKSIMAASAHLASCSSSAKTVEDDISVKLFSTVASSKLKDSRWTQSRLEGTAKQIMTVLKEKKASNSFADGRIPKGVVFDAARPKVGDTGRLNTVLKWLDNVVVENQIIRRVVNPTTRKFEYTIDEVGEKVSKEEKWVSIVYNDVLFLYQNVLMEYPCSEIVKSATRTILDSRHFIKVWPLGDEEDHALTFFCILDDDKSEAGVTVQLEEHAEVLHLKCGVVDAFLGTYDIPHVPDFQIVGLEGLNKEEVLSGKVKSGAELTVRSEGLVDLLKRHGDFKKRDVTCKCGAREDDGERLMQCICCDSWQHRRCKNIEDTEVDPLAYLCASCWRESD